MNEPLSFPQFLLGFVPAVAFSSADGVARADPIIPVAIGNMVVPAGTCLFGLIGAIAARWLALPQERSLGTGRYLVVSLIMTIAVQLWIIEMRPGWLFAFVVAIGVGFTGYALIEQVGDQVKSLVAGAFDTLRRMLKIKDNDDA